MKGFSKRDGPYQCDWPNPSSNGELCGYSFSPVRPGNAMCLVAINTFQHLPQYFHRMLWPDTKKLDTVSRARGVKSVVHGLEMNFICHRNQ